MNITAKFIGKSSLGFIHNNTYQLNIRFSQQSISVLNTDSGLRCEYSRVAKFIENWKVLQVHYISLIESRLDLHLDIYKSMRNSKLEVLLS